MKRLFAFLIALLLALSVFAACGGETETTKPEATEPEATEPETTEPETTEPETNEPETTEPPVLDPDPLEPTVAADPSHTEHIWYSLPTFTAYEAKQADGTIGYLATHCRYEGCEAVKDGVVRPTLVNMDFESFNGTLAQYADAAENVCAHKKGASNSPGTVADGMGQIITSKSQTIISTDFVWEYGKEYYISMDFQLNVAPRANKNLHILTFGRGSQEEAARYFVGVGYNPEAGKWYVTHNFSFVHELIGVSFELGKWYRLEYVVLMGNPDGGIYESPASTAEKPVYITGGAAAMYLTPMHRTADGEMVIAGERIYLGTYDGIAAIVNDKKEALAMDYDYIKLDSNGACQAVDNLIVALEEKDK